MLEIHRIAIEERSGIWLLFYETLICGGHYEGYYNQELIRIFGHRIRTSIRFITAENAALFMMADRKVNTPLIIRADSEKNKMRR